MSQGSEDARRRRLGIALIALVAALFVVELIALAVGNLVIAAACAAVFIVGWFVLRAQMRRAGRE
jgi:hypothetical protein